jgi:hypothetical protein
MPRGEEKKMQSFLQKVFDLRNSRWQCKLLGSGVEDSHCDAETVSKEKAIVEVETSAAEEEAAKTKIIQDEVSAKAKATSDDLVRAEPAVEEAMAALNSLNEKDLTACRRMGTPPKGVGEVFRRTVRRRQRPRQESGAHRQLGCSVAGPRKGLAQGRGKWGSCPFGHRECLGKKVA